MLMMMVMAAARVLGCWCRYEEPSDETIGNCGVVGADEGGKIHPTQKPIKLYEYLLNNYAHDGFKILDTHVGSASSLIACHRRHLPYVGFELDTEYYEKAKARLEAEQAQIDIFDAFGFNPYQE